MPVSLKDVAKHANVSPATVSGVINRRSYCWASEETAARVMKAVEELGYRPNRMARGLRLKAFMTVGLIVPDLTNPFYAALSRTLTERLEKSGYAVVVEDNMASLANEQRSFERIFERQVDGVIASLIDPAGWVARQGKAPASKPVLLLGGAPDATNSDVISTDFKPGLTEAVRHLVELGHRRVAFFGGHIGGVAMGTSRLRIVTAELKKHGLTLPEELRLSSDITLHGAYDAFDSFLRRHDRAMWPTAVVALNDWLAIATMGAAKRHGLRVPEDLSVVGVDDIELARYLPVTLSTLAQPLEQMADRAVTLLLQKIEGKKRRAPVHETLPVVYVPRESTGPARPSR